MSLVIVFAPCIQYSSQQSTKCRITSRVNYLFTGICTVAWALPLVARVSLFAYVLALTSVYFTRAYVPINAITKHPRPIQFAFHPHTDFLRTTAVFLFAH